MPAAFARAGAGSRLISNSPVFYPGILFCLPEIVRPATWLIPLYPFLPMLLCDSPRVFLVLSSIWSYAYVGCMELFFLRCKIKISWSDDVWVM